MIFANYMFVGRGLTQIYADKTNKKSEFICGPKNIKKPARQRATLKRMYGKKWPSEIHTAVG
jgi:hypothetical protein